MIPLRRLKRAPRCARRPLVEGLEGRALLAASLVPVGGEIPVNTLALGNPSRPSVAADAAGNFVVAWQSKGEAGDWDVYARRFGASGAPLGDAFPVNTSTAGNQQRPTVAAAADGRFVIAWDGAEAGTDDQGVYARRFDPAGAPLGDEFLVNTTADAVQATASIGMAPDGRFVIAWADNPHDGDGWGVFARRFDAAGTPLGDQFPATQIQVDNQVEPAVAVAGDGRFVVAWTSDRDGQATSDVVARVFGADGAPLTGDLGVTTDHAPGRRGPAVAAGPGGDFVVAWTAPDAQGDGVYARRHAPDGAPRGDAVAVNQQTAGDQTAPAVVIAADGSYVVAWQSAGQDGDGWGVYARSFDASSAAAGDEVRVNTATAGDQADAALARGGGTLVAAWDAAAADGSGLGVFAQRLAPAAATVPTISVADASAVEGSDGAAHDLVFTLTLSAASDVPVTVDYATADGTAAAGGDYTARTGTVTFAPGATTATVAVPVVGDALDESDETFSLTLSNPVGATLADGQATGTITDDDDPPPAVSVTGPAATAEPDAGATAQAVFTVTLSGARSYPVTVHYATRDGAAGVPRSAAAPADYAAASGTLTFAPGETSKTVAVTVNGDNLDEFDEGFTLALSDPTNATLGTAEAAATITDNDPPPAVSITDATVTEGNPGDAPVPVVFTVTLSAPSGQTVNVPFVSGGPGDTAFRFEDFNLISDILSFAPGETTKTITAFTVPDALDESDETFSVLLAFTGRNYTIDGDGIGVATVVDDDPTPKLSIGEVSVAEGDSAAGQVVDIPVVLSAPSGRAVSVNWSTLDDTAASPGDYESTGGSLVFQPGETSKIIQVRILGDETPEADETFWIDLYSPQNATAEDGKVTIRNDDASPTPVVSVSGAAVTEGGGGLSFVVTLDRASSRDVTVNYATADDTAVAPGDYVAAGGALVFAAGETSKTVVVAVNDDALHEVTERVALELTGATGAEVGTARAFGLITDNDAAPSVSVDDATVVEGDAGSAGLVFTVRLSGASGLPVSVDFTTADGTATAGADYAASSGTLTFAPGETERQVTIAVVGDDTAEANETVLFNLSAPDGATVGDAQAVGTITDDDQPVVDPPLVRVQRVYVSGAGWSAAFKQFLADQGLGSASFGYAVPAADQLNELPWTNVNQISVEFLPQFAPEPAPRQGDLVLHGVNVADYPVLSFTYDAATHTGTWTFDRTIQNDKLRLNLTAGDGGVQYLDGEWDNAGDTFPSGDGTAGGDFGFRLNNLPGDVNRDGRVNAVDLSQVRARQLTSTTNAGTAPNTYAAFFDVNGDGRVNAVDLAQVRANQLKTLPTAEPAGAAPLTGSLVTRDLFGTQPILP